MRLRATVRRVTGKTRHLLGALPLPHPKIVELVLEEDGAIFLLRLDDEGQCISDTWHETVEAAKAQAKFEYEIEEGDWETG
jgi:hypothetical protein